MLGRYSGHTSVSLGGRSDEICARFALQHIADWEELDLPIAGIDRVRKNHALEHATVAVLLERGTSPPLGGYSLPSGFIIWAKAPDSAVLDAAEDALLLLKEGHSDLAVSSYCGTNFVAAALLGGVAALIAGQGRGFWPRVRGAAVGLVTASVLSRPVGKLLQRRLTTEARVHGTEITSARVLKKAPLTVIWFSTASVPQGGN